jgi:hypothetical protein
MPLYVEQRRLIDSLESRTLLAAGYQIELVYGAGVTSEVREAAQLAAARWQQVVSGDVPDVGSGGWGGPVDDIRISVSVVSIDGIGGGVARTRPNFVRDGTRIPISGEIQFDTSDLSSLVNSRTLVKTMTHEMVHAIGFGSLWRTSGLIAGAGTSTPTFRGLRALAEYRTLARDPAATGVPLEATGGTGTQETHWDRFTFGNELLTGFIVASPMPLSRITIASLADLGYTVNYAAADAFALPTNSVNGQVFNDLNNNGRRDGRCC